MIVKGQTVYAYIPEENRFIEGVVNNVGTKLYKVLLSDNKYEELVFFSKDKQERDGYVVQRNKRDYPKESMRLYESKKAMEAYIKHDNAVQWLRNHIVPWYRYDTDTLKKIREAIENDPNFGKDEFVSYQTERIVYRKADGNDA